MGEVGENPYQNAFKNLGHLEVEEGVEPLPPTRISGEAQKKLEAWGFTPAEVEDVRFFTSQFRYDLCPEKVARLSENPAEIFSREERDYVNLPVFYDINGRLDGQCGDIGRQWIIQMNESKLIKKSGKIEQYTYYHCTRKKTTINCSQRKMLPLDKLETQIEKELEGLTILPEFRTWALEVLNENNDREIEDRTKVYEMQHNNLVTTQKELDNLTKMRYRDLIDDNTFIKERNELQTKITEMKGKLRHTEDRAERWLELTERTFNFATYARMMFLKANEMGRQGLELKKEILMALGLNTQIKAGKLYTDKMEWFVPIEKRAPLLQNQYLGLELNKKPDTKAKTEALSAIRAQWRT